MCTCRSSGGTKGGSESEADPFVQPKTTNSIKYEFFFSFEPLFSSALILNLFYFINRDEQFKVPKRKVSARRMRIESHPTDVHKGMYIN